MKDFSDNVRQPGGTAPEDMPADVFLNDSERRAFVARWLKANRRRMAAGLGFATLALPMLASAQTQEMVAADGIDGVASVTMGADGSATIVLVSGQQIFVPASQVQVVDGVVMISAGVADIVAEAGGAAVPAPVAGDMPAGAGVAAGLVGIAAVAAASSSSGSGSGPAPVPTVDFGALPGGGVLNASAAGVPQVITGTVTDLPEDGSVAFQVLAADGSVVTQGPVAVADDGSWTVEIDPGDVDGAPLPDGSYTIRVVVSRPEEEDVTGDVALEVDLTPPVVTVDAVAGDDVITAAEAAGGLTLSGSVDGVDAGTEVTVAFAGETYTTEVAADGSWSVDVPEAVLAALADGASPEVAVSVSDPAGNEGTATRGVTIDYTPPAVEIDPVAGDDVITAAEAAGGLMLSGSTIAGAPVTVAFAGETFSTTADGDGAWSVEVPEAALAALADGATPTVEVTALDALGNPGTGSRDTTIDYTPPAITIDPVATDNVVTTEDAVGGITLSGGSERAISLQVSFGDETYDVMPDADGSWSVEVSQDDLVALGDGATPTVSVVGLDALGSPGTATQDVTLELPAPTVAIDSIAGDDVIVPAEIADGITITGTATGATTVTVSFVGQTYTADVDADGGWSVPVPADDLAGLADLDTPMAQAGVTNALGFEGTAEAEALVDLGLPRVFIDDIGTDNTLLPADQGQEFTISGRTENIEEGQPITVTVTGPEGFEEVRTADVAADGSWSVTLDAPALDEASFDVRAEASDAAGTAAAPASSSFATQYTVPSAIALDPLGTDGNFDLASDELTVTGTTEGVAEGETVTVTVRGNDYTGTVAADGTFAVAVAGAAFAGAAVGSAVGVAASVTDLNGADIDAAGDVTAYAAARNYLTEAGVRDGDLVAMAIEFDPRFSLPGDGGFNLGESIAFDPSVLAFAADPAPAYGAGLIGIPNLANADQGEITLGGIGVNLTTALTPATFSLTAVDAGAVGQIDVTPDTAGAGLYTTFLGTDGDDTIVATDVDTVIRGRGGDDQIDVSGFGVNTVIFEATAEANGDDTVTGFTLADDGPLPDRIGFAGLETAPLRGDGFAVVGAGDLGGPLPDGLGFVVVSTAVDSLDDLPGVAQGALDAGLGDGESIFVMGGDGSDAELWRGDNDEGAVTLTKLATFEGIGDLSGFGAANVLGLQMLADA